ncbi:MAG: hypothetical protein U0797_01390 [Gemmataceae bacterium]
MPSGLPRLAGLFLLVAACLAALRVTDGGLPPAAGQFRQDLRPKAPKAGQTFPPNVVKQGFPAARFDPAEPEKSDTAWEIEWELTHPENKTWFPPGSVMRIKSARFMWKDRTGQPRWMTVVRMLEIAEIYVPYDNGNTAFLDVHDMSFNMTPARKEFLGPNCVAPGEILTSSNPAWSSIVHKEVHDDGVRWMSAETNSRNQIADRVRRGEKLLLWGTYYGANYRYMMEYGFTDDGVISCRIGPTGRNIFNRQKDQGDTHLHVGCWRMEMDLGDPKNNEVLLSRRVFDEEKERFAQVARPFNKNARGEACEGSARWNPDEFTTLRVSSKARKNAHGYPVSYDVLSHRYGATHLLQREGGTLYSDSDMDFINQDFWVTRTESGFTDYIDVPRYAKDKRPLTGQPTTIWLTTPAIHVARTEDFDTTNGTNSYGGVAITTWAGFFLKPRDLFDGTPLYTPTRRSFR